MLQPKSSTSRVMMIGLSSKELSLIDLSVLTRWTIRPRLLGVPGVANVSVWGQRQRHFQVQVDPDRLQANGVTTEQIIRTAGNSLWISPLSYLNASTPGVTGGFIDTPTQRLGIRHVLPISNASDLSQVVVADAGMHLGDVASVVEDHQPLIGDAVINGEPGLLLTIEKLPTGNTLEITRGVDKALESLRPALSGVEINSTLFRPASFIEQAVDNLLLSLIFGCLLIVLVLGAFLYQWRTALISIVAIPLSLVAAGLVLQMRGTTLNTMILAGLVVALGSVVDDAIIDVENITRRLREARRTGSQRSIASIILEASLEVRGAIIFATLIIVLAVVPVLFMDGVSGAFFQPLAISYALALLASMIVALTVTPALSLILLAKAPVRTNEPPLMRWLGRGYQRALTRTLRRPQPAFAAMAALTVVSLAVLPFLGQSLLPRFKENDFLLHWVSSPGTSLPEMARITTAISRDVRADPGVRNFAGQIGRAVQGDEIVSINSGQNWISVDPRANHDATVSGLQRLVDAYPGLSRDVLTYLQERIRQVLTGSGSAEPVVVRVFGTDLDVLRQKAEEVRAAVAGVEGVADARVLLQVEEPTIEVKVDLNAIQPYGLKPGDVRRAMATLISGLEVGNLFEQEKVFDVVVTGTSDARHSLTSLQNLLVETPTGGHVRVADIASVRVVPSANIIKREGASRYIDVGVGVNGRDLGAVSRDVEARVHGVQFPREFHAEILGEYVERQAAQNRLLVIGLAALLGIFLLLQAAFGSWKLAGVAFVALPTATRRRRSGGVPQRRLDLARFARRISDGTRHRRAQWDYAYPALQTSPGARRRTVRGRPGPARGSRAAGADPDDGGGDRSRTGAVGRGRQRARSRNRTPDGHRRSRRSGHVHAAEPVPRPGAVSPLRSDRQTARGCRGARPRPHRRRASSICASRRRLKPTGETRIMHPNNRWLIALPIASVLALAACTNKPPAATKVEHAITEKVDANLKKVVLSAEAAGRLAIKTEPVRDEHVVRTRIIGGAIVALPASEVAEAAPTPVMAAASSMSPGSAFRLALRESFERNTLSWPDDPNSTAWFDPDGLGYRLAAVEPGRHVAVAVPGQTDLADLYVSAVFRKNSGPAGGGYGLIIRDQFPSSGDGVSQSGSYYVFAAGDRGEFGVWQRDGEQWVEVMPWTASSAVKTGASDNELAVAAVGDSMTFLINGTPVTTQTDTKLKHGGVGIFVGGDGDQFQVNDLVVRAPAPALPAAAAPGEPMRNVLRVTLSASDQNQVVRGQAVKVLPLLPDPMASGITAEPTQVSGDSRVLFFAADGLETFKVGQRVRVDVPLVGGGESRKVVPYSSLIYDLKGEAWAYTSPAPLTFVRDRVNVDFIDGDKAVLSHGPAAGTSVVTTGAAELYGTEAGVGH